MATPPARSSAAAPARCSGEPCSPTRPARQQSPCGSIHRAGCTGTRRAPSPTGRRASGPPAAASAGSPAVPAATGRTARRGGRGFPATRLPARDGATVSRPDVWRW
ncbi:hypothetical protein G6F65_020728 [Rhizopus arrhizus]|nr:hypothetical protein G6F23_015497 [Rhizopus arrhizus]KAG1246359.1 hypothetical protein G6F65_020728 [Rhizopus arrhizus]